MSSTNLQNLEERSKITQFPELVPQAGDKVVDVKKEVQEEIDARKRKRGDHLVEKIDILHHERAVLRYEDYHSPYLRLTKQECVENRKRRDQIREEIEEKFSDLRALAFSNEREAAQFESSIRGQWQGFERNNQKVFKGDAEYRAALHFQQRDKYKKLRDQTGEYKEPGLKRSSYQPWTERRKLAAVQAQKTFEEVNRKSFSVNREDKPKAEETTDVPNPRLETDRRGPPRKLTYELRLPEPKDPPEPGAKGSRPGPQIRRNLRERKATVEAKKNEPTEVSEAVDACQRGDTTSCNPPAFDVSPIPSPRLNSESTGKGKERTKDPEKEGSVFAFGSRRRD